MPYGEASFRSEFFRAVGHKFNVNEPKIYTHKVSLNKHILNKVMQ